MAIMRFITCVFVVVARVSGGVSTLFHYFAASTLRLADIKEGIQNAWHGFNSREADVAAGEEAGANAYVTKPFSPQELEVRVEEMLGKR